MPKLSVCIEMFWRDLPYHERIRRVAELGYGAFEFWGWGTIDLDAIDRARRDTGLSVAAFCMHPEADLTRRNASEELVHGLADSIAVAQRLECPTLIAMFGNTVDDETYEMTRRRVVAYLRLLRPLLEDSGLTLVLEPLNTLVNRHGYWLRRMSQAADIVDEVNSPAIRILMDVYHQQITEGNIISNLRLYSERIAHIHAAGVPERHELLGCELDYRSIFSAIDALDYAGYVGLEYWPTLDEDDSLAQPLSLV